MRELNIPKIFKREAEEIKRSRQRAIDIHGSGDIKAAGNEIEEKIREFFRRMLPKNLYVSHGHLIDQNGIVSPQLDIIISDTTNLPSLMTLEDGTEYIPIDSVYAIGEIKSTYYKNSKYIESFSDVLSKIKNDMVHEEIINTAYMGTLNDYTIMRDLFLGKGNKILNKIYSFMLFVDKGNFSFSDIKSFYKNTERKYLPNSTVIMNSGLIFYGKIKPNEFSFERYPEDVVIDEHHWYYIPSIQKDDASIEGNTLGSLYHTLILHISNSYLEHPNLNLYLKSMLNGKKSETECAD